MFKKLGLLFKVNSNKMRYLAYSQPNPVSLQVLNKIDTKPKINLFDFCQANNVKCSSMKDIKEISLNMPL